MTAPAGEWRLIREECRPGPMQMALDEVAAETVSAGGPATVRTYRWDPSCLTLGYSQDPDTIDWEACERAGVDVTRRRTGGGGIYHDHDGDIAYSIAVGAADVPGELLEAYHLLCTPVLDAFARLGVDADYVDEPMPALYHPACYLRELHPAHDIVADSRKIAGNAQYRTRDAVVQHGSLSFTVEAAAHLDGFADPPVSTKAVRDRVVGIDDLVEVDRTTAVDRLEAALADWVAAGDGTLDRDGSWTDDELTRARSLVETRYQTDEWVRRRPGE